MSSLHLLRLIFFYSLLATVGLPFFDADPGYAARTPGDGPGKDLSVKMALLAFENLSEDMDAQRMVMPAVRKWLTGEGIELVDEDSLNKVLFRERVRVTAHITRDLARKIGDELNVRAVLLGCIVRFYSEESLQIGLLARLIDTSTGHILWANYASVSGREFAGILGLGEITTMEGLVPKAVDRLFDSFSVGPTHVGEENVHKVAVMPLKNNSGVRVSGMAVTYMFLVELFKSRRFEVVEYGEVRKALVSLRISGKGELDLENLEALSTYLGVEEILLGTVENYFGGQDVGITPSVEITTRLLDASEKRILWYDSLQRSGEKSIILFTWEGARPVDETALGAVSQLIERMEKMTWR